MKSKGQILEKIENLQLDVDSIHELREELKSSYGGIDSEQNSDMLLDIATLNDRIALLKWVVSE